MISTSPPLHSPAGPTLPSSGSSTHSSPSSTSSAPGTSGSSLRLCWPCWGCSCWPCSSTAFPATWSRSSSGREGCPPPPAPLQGLVCLPSLWPGLCPNYPESLRSPTSAFSLGVVAPPVSWAALPDRCLPKPAPVILPVGWGAWEGVGTWIRSLLLYILLRSHPPLSPVPEEAALSPPLELSRLGIKL